MQRRNFFHLQAFAFFIVCTVAVTAAYFPGLNGPFIADDFPNFVQNDLVRVDALTEESFTGR